MSANNITTTPLTYTLSVETDPAGPWDPQDYGGVLISAESGLWPPDPTGVVTITVPYGPEVEGTLALTTTLTTNDGACNSMLSPLGTTLSVGASQAEAWPMTPRLCVAAGQAACARFGVFNSDFFPVTYDVSARTYNPDPNNANDTFGINGAGQAKVALKPVTVAPFRYTAIEVTCQTMGICFTGAENIVEMEVVPRGGGAPVGASSPLHISDPAAICPLLTDPYNQIPGWALVLAAIGLTGGGAVVAYGCWCWLNTLPLPARRTA